MENGEIKEILKGISGFRDYYPEDFVEIQHVLKAMKKVSRDFGYEEYEGPSMEYAKLIEIKSGAELMDETFVVIGKDERKLVLRPEQTPTLARMIVNQHQRYSKPIRWFCIPRCFRNETPQKGRVREFWQFNADILGVEHPGADAEIIALTTGIIKQAGLQEGEFVCVINNRELLQGYLEFLEVRNYLDVIKIIDARGKVLQENIEKTLKKERGVSKVQALELAKKIRLVWEQDPKLKKKYPKLANNPVTAKVLKDLKKIDENGVISALKEKGLSHNQAHSLYKFSSINGKPEKVIEELEKIEMGEKAKIGLDTLKELIGYLDMFGVLENCEYDTSIARGLDYYTGVVFEFLDRTGSVVRAIAGGGRYDQLVNALGGDKIVGTGIGMGETVLMTILKDLGRMKPYKTETDVYVATVSNDVIKEAGKIVNTLRKHFNVIFNPFNWKFSQQRIDATGREIPIMIVVGKRDLEKDSITIQDLRSKEQDVVPIDEMIPQLTKKLTKISE